MVWEWLLTQMWRARTHSRRPWAQLYVLSQQLVRRSGNKAITNEMALIIKTQLQHSHFLDPLVSFVPLSDNAGPHWVSIRYWMKTQWGGNTLAYLLHSIWLLNAVYLRLCFPLKKTLSAHPTTIWFSLGATGNGPPSAGENGSTQELMMHSYSRYYICHAIAIYIYQRQSVWVAKSAWWTLTPVLKQDIKHCNVH